VQVQTTTDSTLQEIEQIAAIAEQSSAASEEMLASTEMTSTALQQIAAIAQQSSASTQEVSASVDSLAGVLSQTASVSQQVASGSQQVSASMQQQMSEIQQLNAEMVADGRVGARLDCAGAAVQARRERLVACARLRRGGRTAPRGVITGLPSPPAPLSHRGRGEPRAKPFGVLKRQLQRGRKLRFRTP
jgi:ABC-type transporter Mla subunit MlaD